MRFRKEVVPCPHFTTNKKAPCRDYPHTATVLLLLLLELPQDSFRRSGNATKTEADGEEYYYSPKNNSDHFVSPFSFLGFRLQRQLYHISMVFVNNGSQGTSGAVLSLKMLATARTGTFQLPDPARIFEHYFILSNRRVSDGVDPMSL